MVNCSVELWLDWAGGLAALVALGVIFYGIWRGINRPQQDTGRPEVALLRKPIFYLLTGLAYFGLCLLIWRPLPLFLTPAARTAALVVGAPLFLAGLALVLWGRLTLGKYYFVSNSLGALLFADHRLIETGPYSLMRHPMYLGILLIGLGGILQYRTWTMVFFALNFLGLVVRARREEQALEAEFGEAWQDYCQRVPRWLPRIHLSRFERLSPHISLGLEALLEVFILFLPAIPAYLWVWPVLEGTPLFVFQCLVYGYILLGTLWIGLRRWNLRQLGLNLKGVGVSLVCALVILAGRLMIILSVKWTIYPAHYNWIDLIGQVIYYFGLVGLVEELLFRGLVYHALEQWLGSRWAIWGSAFGFMLWHIFGQGPLIGVTTLVIGWIFALIRWRAGGILGLIVLHALYDLESILLVTDSNAQIANLSRPEIPYPGLTIAGLLLMLAVPFYLWLIHGRLFSSHQ